jgi:superfamily I DNA and/or RNA helicase
VNYAGQIAMISNTCRVDGRETDRKLNVAVTRSRERLILLGRSDVLNTSASYSQMLDFINSRGYYRESADFDESFGGGYIQ